MHQDTHQTSTSLSSTAMIPTDTIQLISATARIEEVVTEFLALRRRGSNLVGLCPFHAERTPSFTVNPVRNIFNCFGCGQKGDAVKFLQVHEQMSFPEAIRWLGRKYSIEINEGQAAPNEAQEQREAMLAINEFACKYFRYRLGHSSAAQGYLESRGIASAALETFNIGYASGPNDLALWLSKRLYSAPLSEAIGLTAHGRDFFRERVMFPIHSLSGKVVGFAGRAIGRVGEGQQPKYLNSRESEAYQKARSLYGLFQAKRSIRQTDTAVLVEGYLDVIALHQAGITNAVAGCGTAITPEQMLLVRRNAGTLVICFDGDTAGNKAAVKAIELGVATGLQVRIAELPVGHDPDSYVRTAGAAAMIHLLDTAPDWLEYLSAVWLAPTAAPTKKADSVRSMARLIGSIEDGLVRTAYTQRLSEVSAFPLSEINRAVVEASARQGYKDEQPIQATTVRHGTREAELERVFVLTLIQHGAEPIGNDSRVGEYLLGSFECVAEMFTQPLYRQIAEEALMLVQQGALIWEAYFAAHTEPAIRLLSYEAANDDTPFCPEYTRMLLLTFKVAKLDALLLRHRQHIGTATNPEHALAVHAKILSVKGQLIAQMG